MLKQERLAAITAELHKAGSVTTDGLSRQLHISQITIRRDLAELESSGILRREYGGATLVPSKEGGDGDGGKLLAAARGMAVGQHSAQGQGPLIGLIVPTADYYFGPIIRGVVAAGADAGVRVVVGVSHYRREEEVSLITRMLATGVRALIITPESYNFEAHRPLLDALDGMPVPVVLLERAFTRPSAHQATDTVRTNHELGAELAVRHLAGLGRRHIALHLFDNATAPRLRDGYLRALRELGLSEPSITLEIEPEEMTAWGHDPSHPLAARFVDQLIAHGVDALVVNPDLHAATLARLAIERGLRVPEDLAIVAYDDEIAAFSDLPLTAVAPPKHDLGLAALQLAVRRVVEARAGVTSSVQHVLLVPELRIRDSTTTPNDHS